jgi:serine/threonine protein kinase
VDFDRHSPCGPDTTLPLPLLPERPSNARVRRGGRWRSTRVRALPTKCLEILHRLSNTDTDSISFETLQFLAAGKSGIVYGIDHKRVLKEFHESDVGEVERRAYQRLDSHPNIAKLLGTRKDGSIILERGEILRTICRSPSENEIPIQRKLRWLKHAAAGYQHIHDCHIIHADVGCNNMIVTSKGDLKIIDLEGCSIDGEPADSCYEWFSYRPSIPRVSRRTDIFAFGCAIYEVITGRPPYHELEASNDRYWQVEQLYTNNRFPDVTHLPLGQLIRSCWHGDLTSMSEVIRELEAFRPIPVSRNELP